jgi:hypothetical protein
MRKWNIPGYYFHMQKCLKLSSYSINRSVKYIVAYSTLYLLQMVQYKVIISGFSSEYTHICCCSDLFLKKEKHILFHRVTLCTNLCHYKNYLFPDPLTLPQQPSNKQPEWSWSVPPDRLPHCLTCPDGWSLNRVTSLPGGRWGHISMSVHTCRHLGPEPSQDSSSEAEHCPSKWAMGHPSSVLVCACHWVAS